VTLGSRHRNVVADVLGVHCANLLGHKGPRDQSQGGNPEESWVEASNKLQSVVVPWKRSSFVVL
jgi:hypothetical protein